MKKILIALLTLVITSSIAPSALAAYSIPKEYEPSNIAESRTGTYETMSINYILADLVSGLLAIVGIVAVFFLVSNGLLYATSMGQQDKIDKAKKGMTWALVGLMAILISYILVRFVIRILFTVDESVLTEVASRLIV